MPDPEKGILGGCQQDGHDDPGNPPGRPVVLINRRLAGVIARGGVCSFTLLRCSMGSVARRCRDVVGFGVTSICPAVRRRDPVAAVPMTIAGKGVSSRP